jgi:hypothetical protein
MAEDAAAGLARQPKKLSHRVVVAASGGNNKAVSVTTAGELSLTEGLGRTYDEATLRTVN